MRPPSVTRRGRPLALLLSACALLLFFAALQLIAPPDGFFSGDQGAKYLQTRAFAAQGPFHPGIHVASADIDPGLRHQILENRGGQLVGVFTWLLPLSSAPFFAVLGMRGLSVVPAVSAVAIFLACVWLAGLVSDDGTDGRRDRRCVAIAWIAVLCAPVLVYGGELWEHAPAAAGVSFAACLLAPTLAPTGVTGTRGVRALLGGAAVGIAAIFREEAILALPAFVVGRFLASPRSARVQDAIRAGTLAAAGALTVFALSVPMNLVVYRSPLPLHLAVETGKAQAHPPARVTLVADYLLPNRARAVFIGALAGAVVAVAAFRRTSKRGWLLAALGAAFVLLGIAALLPLWRMIALGEPTVKAYSLDSIAHTWPFAIALILLPLADDIRTGVVRYLAVAALLMIAGTLAVVPSSGGAQWSPRYLFPVAPLLAVLAALPAVSVSVARRADARLVSWAARAALVSALAMQIDGLRYLVDAKTRNARITRRLAALTQPGDVVITDIAWLAQVAAELIPSRRVVVAWAPDQVGALARDAGRAGIRTIALVVSLPETGFAPPRTLDGGIPGQSCVFTRSVRQDLGERGLILHRYTCAAAEVVVK